MPRPAWLPGDDEAVVPAGHDRRVVEGVVQGGRFHWPCCSVEGYFYFALLCFALRQRQMAGWQGKGKQTNCTFRGVISKRTDCVLFMGGHITYIPKRIDS
jgi:hypothetical protein